MNKPIYIFLFVFFLFTQLSFSQRISETINSNWYFYKGSDKPDIISSVKDHWSSVNLPHTWNSEDTIDDEVGYYKGQGWYFKEFFIDESEKGKHFYLYFEGVNQETDVFVNGIHIGNHKGGYTAFSFDMTPNLIFDNINKIEVKVDNSHNENIAPLSADFNFYGGIYRNVRLIKTNSIHFDMSNNASDGVFVNYKEVKSNRAILQFDGMIQNDSKKKERLKLTVEILDDQGLSIAKESKTLVVNALKSKKFSIDEVSVSNPKLWSPDNPYLYKSLITITKESKEGPVIIDQISLPVGIKSMSFDAQGRFVLNGVPLKLIGSNRHQDIYGYGNALTNDQHYNDFKRIKDLGFNFVRLAHYPQAPEVYRACDELGLLIWSEIPVVNEITENEAFAVNSLNMQREQIRQTYNHPSVIMYGYMNELFLLLEYSSLPVEEQIEKSKKIVSLAKKLNQLTKEDAPNHFSVMAFHGSKRYNEWGLADIPDVVGWNLYFGWYNDQMEDLSKFLISEHENYPNRKLIVSEFGPGADVRLHSKTPKAWDYSEDFQIQMHTSYLKQMMNLDFLSGFAVWNYADFGSEIRNDAIPFVNQKGLLNFDRSYKDVAYLYKAWFGIHPMAHIASRNQLNRSSNESEFLKGTTQENLKIISNLKQISLSVNGEHAADVTPVDYQEEVQVNLREGTNVIEVFSDSKVLDRIEIENKIIPKEFNFSNNIDIAVNVGSEASFFDTKNQVLWIADQHYNHNRWGSIGGKKYITEGFLSKPGISKNINGTVNDPLFQTFNEGIDSYYFEIPNGVYQLSLLFQEYQEPNSDQSVVYNLNQISENSINNQERIFDIYANGQMIKSNLNILNEVGSLNALQLDFEIPLEGGKGLKIDFKPLSGKPILSGIRIMKK